MKYFFLLFICLTRPITCHESEASIYFDKKEWRLFGHSCKDNHSKYKYYPVQDNQMVHHEKITFSIISPTEKSLKKFLKEQTKHLDSKFNWYSLTSDATFTIGTEILEESSNELVWETKLTDTEYGLPWYFLSRCYRDQDTVYFICYRTYGCCFNPYALKAKWLPLLTEYTLLLSNTTLKGDPK